MIVDDSMGHPIDGLYENWILPEGVPTSTSEEGDSCINHLSTKIVGCIIAILALAAAGYLFRDHIFTKQFGVGFGIGVGACGLIVFSILGLLYDRSERITKTILKILGVLVLVVATAGVIDWAHNGQITTQKIPHFFHDMTNDCHIGINIGAIITLICTGLFVWKHPF